MSDSTMPKIMSNTEVQFAYLRELLEVDHEHSKYLVRTAIALEGIERQLERIADAAERTGAE